MKKNKLIPFSWMPGSWGLKGKSRKMAEIEYYYEDGEEKEKLLAEAELDDEQKLRLKVLDIDLKYEKISELEYEKQKATVLKEPWVHAELAFPDNKNPLSGSVEVDYNEFWIDQLRHRFPGSSDEEILDNWIKALNAQLLYESGVLDIGYDDEGLSNREDIGDGRAGYS